MPVLDAARFLREAVDSVLAQTLDDLELLIVDDGSSDDGPAIAAEYARRDPRVRCLAHPGGGNRGTAAARALGFAVARGEFVALLDGDDVWLPVRLARHVAELRAHPAAGWLYGPTLYWHGWTGRPADVARDRYSTTGFAAGAVLPPPVALVHMLRHPSDVPCVCALLARRTALMAAGAADEPPIRDQYEDQAIIARLAVSAPVVVSGHAYDRYRQHPASVWARAGADGSDAEMRRRYLAWLDADLAARGIADASLRAALEFAREDAWAGPARGAMSLGSSSAEAAARRTARLAFRAARRVLPAPAYALARRAVARARGGAPPVGGVRFGDLRTTEPFDRAFGYGRGGPVDRVYIEAFLERQRHDVRGRVLEVGDPTYTLRVTPDNPRATLVGSLEAWPDAPEDAFDCVILTQTLHLLYDVRAAVATLQRILKPGGVLLMTVPGITPIDRNEWGASWYWALTSHSVRRLLGEAFGPAGEVRVEAHGNVLTATAFLYGLGAGELATAEYAPRDPAFEVIVGARAVKAGFSARPEPAG